MEQLIIGAILLVVEALILFIATRLQKSNSQIKNEIKLVHIKHEAWVQAYGFFEKNGLLNKYNELVEKQKSDERWIKTT